MPDGVPRRAAAALLVCGLTVAVFGTTLLTFIPSWLIGVLVAVAHAGMTRARSAPVWPLAHRATFTTALAGSGLLLAAGMTASNLLAPPRPVELLLVGACAAPFILTVALAPQQRDGRGMSRLARLGTISFSIYVFHLAIVKLLLAVITSSAHISGLAAIVLIYAVELLP